MRLDEPSVDTTRLDKPCAAQWSLVPPTGEHGELSSLKAVPFPKLTGLDNTVGPVPKISGYVFNTLQTNSAAHVPNTNMNLIKEGIHICDLNLYETMFQNWCLIDSLSSMTPDTNDYGVIPPNVNTSSVALPLPNNGGNDPKNLFFTGSVTPTMPVEINNRIKITCFTY